jgi:hypothetical protein
MSQGTNFTEMKMPEVKFNKSGYEIRTDILAMAKDLVQSEWHSKYMGWEIGVKRDEKTNQVVTTVGMPEVPGLDKVLETAERMYSFITASKPR